MNAAASGAPNSALPATSIVAHVGDFAHARCNQFLPAEAGIDRHHQHEIGRVEHVFHAAQRRAGVQRDARQTPLLPDQVERPPQVRGRLGVHGDDPRTGAREIAHIALRPVDHQVDVHRQRPLRRRLEHRQSKRKVRHKAAIHDVEVQIVRAGARHAVDLRAQIQKVRRQERRGHLNHNVPSNAVSSPPALQHTARGAQSRSRPPPPPRARRTSARSHGSRAGNSTVLHRVRIPDSCP